MILLWYNSDYKGRRRRRNSVKNKKSVKRKEKEEKKHTTKQRLDFLKEGPVSWVGLMDGLGGDREGHFRLQQWRCQPGLD